MKQFLLATTLIALPFAAFEVWTMPSPAHIAALAENPGLGDVFAMRAIVVDAQAIAGSGDMAATERRMTDFESAWDTEASRLRQQDGSAWGVVDDAHDVVLHELRSGHPDPAKVGPDLDLLLAALNNPASVGSGPVAPQGTVAGIVVTDDNGQALACEDMLQTFRDELGRATLSATDKAAAEDLQAKATERCNADDDKRSDAFSAQGLALLRK